ncbi:hypothetical protein GY12_16390 [Micrococcus luteus]|nr:hypothetical protein GY12_16390 [Micrococcus luteus]
MARFMPVMAAPSPTTAAHPRGPRPARAARLGRVTSSSTAAENTTRRATMADAPTSSNSRPATDAPSCWLSSESRTSRTRRTPTA